MTPQQIHVLIKDKPESWKRKLIGLLNVQPVKSKTLGEKIREDLIKKNFVK